jgi:light-independent protochlorophyllide reductase subunit N
VIKLDLSRAAQRLDQRFGDQLRVLAYSGSGIETSFTQGEDACLAALVPQMPQRQTSESAHLLVVGTLADVVEDRSRRHFEAMGLKHLDFFPGRRGMDLAAVGPQTNVLLAQPFLGETLRLLQARAPSVAGALSSSVLRVRLPGLRPQRMLLISRNRISKRSCCHLQNRARIDAKASPNASGKKVFFFPIRSLSPHLRVFFIRNGDAAHRGWNALSSRTDHASRA